MSRKKLFKDGVLTDVGSIVLPESIAARLRAEKNISAAIREALIARYAEQDVPTATTTTVVSWELEKTLALDLGFELD